MTAIANTAQHARRHWLRRAMVVILAIVLGAATTVGVSWLVAYRWTGLVLPAVPGYAWSAAEGSKWMYMPNHWPGGEERIGVFVDERASRRTRAVQVMPPPSWSRFAKPAVQVREMYEQATGWPMPALASTQVPSSQRNVPVQVLEGIDLGTLPPARVAPAFAIRRTLPIRPLWPGFVSNSLLYSAVWWMVLGLLLCVFRHLRRWPARRREKHGRCPNCGYDLRGKFDDGCSECGWRRSERVNAEH